LTDAYVPEYLNAKNRELVFDLFMEYNELARSEIVSMTHMSFPTVSKNVDFLLSHNILLEREKSESTTSGLGRKRKKLVFNASAYTALAVHFEGQVVETATIDLSGKVLAHESHQLPDLRDPLSQHALGETLRRQLEGAHSPVLGVGFAFPPTSTPRRTKSSVFMRSASTVPLRSTTFSPRSFPSSRQMHIAAMT